MIWLCLAVVVLIILDRILTPKLLATLKYESRFDCIMAEPNEPVTLESTIENSRRLPVPFVRLQHRLPSDAELCDETNIVRDTLFYRNTEEKFSVRSRSYVKKSFRFSIGRRGIFEVGKYQLSVGDFFGFREERHFGDGSSIVIIPSRCERISTLQALGGFIGDISVRRFIMDDPILTIGFRDYTGHEPMKSISWTRTATAGSLQVKEFDRTAEQTVTVLLNVSGGSDEELEDCFRLTRTVCERLEKEKIPYAFRTNGFLPSPTGAIFNLPDGLGYHHLSTILYGLGGANYTCFYSLHTLIHQSLMKRKHNESFIVITPEPDENDQLILQRLQAFSSNPMCVLVGKEDAHE